ncbi:TPA: hypothetical protein KMV75_002983 [Escherichia coli]|uniref:hypothetical protein n=1 Tax=Escherichia coli TaxID=562 RepID=UPI001C169D75|nr:hypothetical protein [Escherichia coli]MDX7196720.1 hypothetical protein [Escherichia coli]HAX5085165.1 hypothetical protein [Escherichia coli]HAX5117803.1 hypothetical protein [Escherichia coli]HAX5128263.1 hypothetical protein [Escherichia coli]HAX5178760.1 hypothetical protein [Escherichia coli]
MKRIIGVVAGAILLSGCATIVGDETQLVQVNSNPSGASFKVKDESGVIVAQGKTPQGVTLAKSDGGYFGKKSYQITMEKDGYEPVTLPIKANANGWYIGGNLVFGGLIGWLAVDPFNGGMYTLKPKEANASLIPSTKQD